MKCFNNFCWFLSIVSTLIFDNCDGSVNKHCNCGEANVEVKGRIVNGMETTPNKYPWMAAMFLESKRFSCGGSIISDRNIITAGHCNFYVRDPYKATWILGMHRSGFSSGENSYKPLNVLFHPQYKNGTVHDDYDISIVIVDRVIEFNKNVNPICLASLTSPFVGDTVTVSGWGLLQEGGSQLGEVLMETRVKIENDQSCDGMIQEPFFYNPDSMVCAYTPYTDACQGDSGGPLFRETSPNRFELIGTVSYGYGCARPNLPGVYGKVSTETTLSWIQDTIELAEANVCADP